MRRTSASSKAKLMSLWQIILLTSLICPAVSWTTASFCLLKLTYRTQHFASSLRSIIEVRHFQMPTFSKPNSTSIILNLAKRMISSSAGVSLRRFAKNICIPIVARQWMNFSLVTCITSVPRKASNDLRPRHCAHFMEPTTTHYYKAMRLSITWNCLLTFGTMCTLCQTIDSRKECCANSSSSIMRLTACGHSS